MSGYITTHVLFTVTSHSITYITRRAFNNIDEGRRTFLNNDNLQKNSGESVALEAAVFANELNDFMKKHGRVYGFFDSKVW